MKPILYLLVPLLPLVGTGTASGVPQITRGPYLQSASQNRMTVRWRTDEEGDSVVHFGNAPDNLDQTASVAGMVNDHVVPVAGLSPDTTFFYQISTTGATGAVAAGATADHRFTTSPATGTARNTRVWVLGDAGTAGSRQRGVRDAFAGFTATRVPDLMMMLGDNAYDTGTDAEYQAAVFDMYPDTLRRVPLWSTLGNHETAQSTDFGGSYPYFDIFTLPAGGECGGVISGTEHYYSFDHGNIHFICLDSMTANRATNGPMAMWLRDDLAATTTTWIIAFWHHPPYTKGSHDSDQEIELMEMRANFLPILESGGADLVLSGHSHCYERSFLLDGHYGGSETLTPAMKRNPGSGNIAGTGAYLKPLTGPRDHFGAVYAVAGSSGKTSGGSLDHPAMFISLNELGSLVIDVDGSRLDATFVRPGGSPLGSTFSTPDTFTVIKQGAADSDGDGIPDEYEILNNLDRHNPADAALDADGDGVSNLDEFILGQAALSPAPYGWSATVDSNARSTTVSFPTLEGRNYRVFWSADLKNWNPGSPPVVGDGNSKSWIDDGSVTGSPPTGPDQPRRFYRIVVTVP